jgi:hypothetical protein
MRIAQEKVAQYGGRLWGMYTNLQPEVAADGSLSPWRVACARCDAVIRQTVASGGSVGFQVAGGPVNDPIERFRYAVNDAVASYPTMFIETSPDRIDTHQDFLLTGADPIQSQLALRANPSTSTEGGLTPAGDPSTPRATELRVVCEPGVVGRAGTCTATVSDAGGAGATVPGGTDAIAWTTTASGAFTSSRCAISDADATATCSVAYTPAGGSAGTHRIGATYPGDGVHAAASADVELVVDRRRSATSVACGSTASSGSATCTASVADVETGDAIAPSGEVAFAIAGGGALGSCSLAASSRSNSSCSFDYTPSGAGDVSLTAEYTGDPNHITSVADQPASVTIEPAIDTQPPVVAITRPDDGSTVPSRKLMIATEASDDVAVVSVVFAVNGQTACEDSTPGWSCSWRIPTGASGQYVVTATALDLAGNASTSTVLVSLK